MKGKSKANLSLKTKLELPAVFLCCSFFFLVGLFGYSLHLKDDWSPRPRTKLLESVEEYETMPHGKTGDDSIQLIPFQVLSWKPRALYYPNFATVEQCQSIINMSKPIVKPSMVALRKGETGESTKDIRTSYGVFIRAFEDKTGVLDDIETKIAKVTMIPKTHVEAFNVLRYQVGQKYLSHYDVFHPSQYGPQKSQRIATFLLYLSDVEEGGETTFPFESGLGMEGKHNFKDCIGLKVKPRRGDGLLFYSVFSNGTIDPASLHGSCPVIRGEKWVATKWIRDQEYDQ